MIPRARTQRNECAGSRQSEPRTRGRARGAGLFALTLLGTAVLVAGCGSGSSHPSVASQGTTATAATQPITTTGAASGAAIRAKAVVHALAFAQCMRTHGEPNFPEPVFHGHSASEVINPSSGVDPDSPQFAAAFGKCKNLLPNGGASAPAGPTITAAARADYVEAAACMRSHGITDFPDPAFQDNNVSFNTKTPIDTNTPQYENALTACRHLIPAGLPYSSSSGQ
jgi:hypothetical protein